MQQPSHASTHMRQLLDQQPAPETGPSSEFQSGFGPAGPLPSGAARNVQQQQRGINN